MSSNGNGQVRVGVVGVGSMGVLHARDLFTGNVRGARLAAVCDIEPAALDEWQALPRFSSYLELIRSGLVDAVVIATPHYEHTPISIAALEHGLSVLTEKPLGVHKADCQRMIHAYQQRPRPTQVFAEMFNQRTSPRYQKLRSMVQGGELGEIRRVNWIITDWFRSEAYYRSGGWRATWSGEGGGVLLNQCPHNIDLWQWIFGMPARVRAFCGFGRYHEIEVEDQVTAYFEYENGATGVFVTSTGEAPGTNRLEVAGERGKVVLENDGFWFTRNEVPTSEYSRTTSERYSKPKTEQLALSIPAGGTQHILILQNFVDAILSGAELIAPAIEGVLSVELANAMIYSALKAETVSLPLDAEAYALELERLIRESRHQKPAVVPRRPGDVASSFGS
jgi:predicted dehydrogenase